MQSRTGRVANAEATAARPGLSPHRHDAPDSVLLCRPSSGPRASPHTLEKHRYRRKRVFAPGRDQEGDEEKGRRSQCEPYYGGKGRLK